MRRADKGRLEFVDGGHSSTALGTRFEKNFGLSMNVCGVEYCSRSAHDRKYEQMQKGFWQV